jgi:hypothetical protein
MPELTIGSDPSGAEVIIDDEVIGTTPLTIQTEQVTLEQFRAESWIDWDTLHFRLINHDVSRFWWDLTESERRAIAEMAVKNTMFTTYYHGRSGLDNCEGGEGELFGIDCVENALIKYVKFTSNNFYGSPRCYYQRLSGDEEFCMVPEHTYKLPGHYVRAVKLPWGHSMCAIQVRQDMSSIDSWYIFQYWDYDIKPGHWQLPHGARVGFHRPHSVIEYGVDYWISPVAYFSV